MLKVTERKRAKGTMDYKVKQLIHSISFTYDNLERFDEVFLAGLKNIKQLNHTKPSNSYRLEKIGRTIVEVWHICPGIGENDRLLCEVEYVEFHEGMFAKILNPIHLNK